MSDTRRRITEATVELHGTVGPARTTVSAIAELAGVERLTVYRHFPDDTALFQACSSHWRAQHPVPDLAPWAAEPDPVGRLRMALEGLYAYYREGRQMLENVARDAPFVPALAGPLADRQAWFEAARGVLVAGWSEVDARLLAALVGHTLDFRTWASLADQGLGDPESAGLMVELVRRGSAATRRA